MNMNGGKKKKMALAQNTRLGRIAPLHVMHFVRPPPHTIMTEATLNHCRSNPIGCHDQ